jgi:hypothetical protein
MRSPVVFPPMYRWPRPVKLAILAVGGALCVAAYAALVSGLYGMLSAFVEAAR